jgi:uncharacterized protein (DUF697 family)
MVSEETASAPAPVDRRAELAARVVDRFSLWSGAAGLIPVPFVDVTVVSGVQIQMLRKLAAIYDVKFSDSLGKSVLASLVGSLIPATSGMGFASALKGVPVVGTAVSMTSMPILSAGATYLIGRVFTQHFASGGTLLDFDPPDYREFIKEHVDRLKTRLDAPAHPLADPDPTPGRQDRPTSSP